MANDNAILKVEFGQTKVAATALTDEGDHKMFYSSATFWSKKNGYSPVIMPNGILSGGKLTPADSGTNNYVDAAALSAYLNGSETDVSADTDLVCVRGTPTNTYIINSITVDSSGAFAVVSGTAHTAFSETRGASGGPPFIPTTSIEVGQVRFTSDTAAAVTAAEIFQTPGTHKELALQPSWAVKYADVENGVLKYAGVEFVSALPLIHTGSVPKKVYSEYYTPVYSDIPNTRNFKPPLESASVNSEQYYKIALASVSTSINQGSFEMALNDGISDAILQLVGAGEVWFKFYADELETNYYVICQGHLHIDQTFGAGTTNNVSCTISAREKGHWIIG